MKEPSAVTPSRGPGDEVSGVGSRMGLAELFTAYPNLVRAIS